MEKTVDEFIDIVRQDMTGKTVNEFIDIVKQELGELKDGNSVIIRRRGNRLEVTSDVKEFYFSDSIDTA